MELKEKVMFRDQGSMKIFLDTAVLVGWMLISTALVFQNKVRYRLGSVHKARTLELSLDACRSPSIHDGDS